MKFNNCKGRITFKDNTINVLSEIKFNSNSSIDLYGNVINESKRRFMLGSPNKFIEFGEFVGRNNQVEIHLKRLHEQKSFVNLTDNKAKWISYKAEEGTITYQNKTPNRVKFGVTNFIANIPRDYSLQLNGLTIEIIHTHNYKENQNEVNCNIKDRNKKLITITTEIIIAGKKYFELEFEEQNRLCDYVTYILSFLCHFHSVWTYRKDYYNNELIKHHQRNVFPLSYFTARIGKIDYNSVHSWVESKDLLQALITKFLSFRKKDKEEFLKIIGYYLNALSSSAVNVRLLHIFTCIDSLEGLYQKLYPSTFCEPLVEHSMYSEMVNKLFESYIDQNSIVRYKNEYIDDVFAGKMDKAEIIKNRLISYNKYIAHSRKIQIIRNFLGNKAEVKYSDEILKDCMRYRNKLIHSGLVDSKNIEDVILKTNRLMEMIVDIIVKIILDSKKRDIHS